MQSYAECNIASLQDWDEDLKPVEHRSNQEWNEGMGTITALEDAAIAAGNFQSISKDGYGTSVFTVRISEYSGTVAILVDWLEVDTDR